MHFFIALLPNQPLQAGTFLSMQTLPEDKQRPAVMKGQRGPTVRGSNLEPPPVLTWRRLGCGIPVFPG